MIERKTKYAGPALYAPALSFWGTDSLFAARRRRIQCKRFFTAACTSRKTPFAAQVCERSECAQRGAVSLDRKPSEAGFDRRKYKKARPKPGLPACAVRPRLEPARIGRWVVSPPLICFQRPARTGLCREACKPRRERDVPYKRCGFKRERNEHRRTICFASAKRRRFAGMGSRRAARPLILPLPPRSPPRRARPCSSRRRGQARPRRRRC